MHIYTHMYVYTTPALFVQVLVEFLPDLQKKLALKSRAYHTAKTLGQVSPPPEKYFESNKNENEENKKRRKEPKQRIATLGQLLCCFALLFSYSFFFSFSRVYYPPEHFFHSIIFI